MFSVRPYNEEKDFETVCSWWTARSLPRIWKALLPLETTFVVEHDGVPVTCACLYLMNCPDASMVEMLASNPNVSKEVRREGVSLIFSHLEKEAKSRGYRTLVLFSYEDKLKDRYLELGFIPAISNVTTFAKSI